MEEAVREVDLVGEIVDGRFRVEEKLGSGGMGTVWRVQHVVSLQRFALKTLDPTYAHQEEATQRFLREARSAAALKTRHAVRIVDAHMNHQHQGAPLPFLVMELLEGQNLHQILDARARLSPGELVWLAGQLGRALDAAHRQGIVHRDLKPSNVFIAADDDGQPIVKLCDFGIAKLTGDATALADASMSTRTGAMLGTPMYLAPELLRGAGSAVPATDQWSLGLLGFRALAGVEYFAHVRGFPDLVLNIANDPLVPPSQRASGLPRAFDGWFLRSCARRPEDRFPDVPAQSAALALALGNPAPSPIHIDPAAAAIAAGNAETALQPTPPPAAAGAPAARSAPRPRRMIYLAGASVWALCALAALGWLGMRKRTEVHATVTATPAPTPPAVVNAPTTTTTTRTPAGTSAPKPIGTSVSASPPTGMAAKAEPKLEPKAEPVPVRNAATEVIAPPPAPRHRHHASATHRSAPANAESKTAAPLPKGAACRRSAECASGLC